MWAKEKSIGDWTIIGRDEHGQDHCCTAWWAYCASSRHYFSGRAPTLALRAGRGVSFLCPREHSLRAIEENILSRHAGPPRHADSRLRLRDTPGAVRDARRGGAATSPAVSSGKQHFSQTTSSRVKLVPHRIIRTMTNLLKKLAAVFSLIGWSKPWLPSRPAERIRQRIHNSVVTARWRYPEPCP